MTNPTSELDAIKGLGAERIALFAQHGLTTLQQLVDADRHELDLWLDPATNQGGSYTSKSTPYYIGQFQAQARSLLYAADPQPPKWFVAVVDLSVESVVPNYLVKTGQHVDLWFKSDAELERMLRAGEIAREGADNGVHLLKDAGWLPDNVLQSLALGGIYSLEALAEPARQVDVWGEIMSLTDWLKSRGISADISAGYIERARSSIGAAAEAPAAKLEA